MPTQTIQAEIGKTYEDKRTHRKGKLLEFNDKYKTYLLESNDGNTFNVSSSQFKINWIEVAEPRVVNREKANADAKERSKELNQQYVDLMLQASKFADSFNNPEVTIKVEPRKHKFKMFIRRHAVFDMDIRIRYGYCRVWLNERDNDAVSWSATPAVVKYYENSCRNFITEFELDKFPTVLQDLGTLIVDKLKEENNYEI